jgi:hypothetical protein
VQRIIGCCISCQIIGYSVVSSLVTRLVRFCRESPNREFPRAFWLKSITEVKLYSRLLSETRRPCGHHLRPLTTRQPVRSPHPMVPLTSTPANNCRHPLNTYRLCKIRRVTSIYPHHSVHHLLSSHHDSDCSIPNDSLRTVQPGSLTGR